MVDLMRAFAGEFTHVQSIVRNTFWDLDVEDNAYALMETTDGAVAMLHSTATQWRHTFSLGISMAEGSLGLAGILSGTRSYGQESLTIAQRGDTDGGTPQEQRTAYIEDFSWRDEVVDFFDAILNNAPIAIGSSDEALRTMTLLYDIYCADENWRDRFDLSIDRGTELVAQYGKSVARSPFGRAPGGWNERRSGPLPSALCPLKTTIVVESGRTRYHSWAEEASAPRRRQCCRISCLLGYPRRVWFGHHATGANNQGHGLGS